MNRINLASSDSRPLAQYVSRNASNWITIVSKEIRKLSYSSFVKKQESQKPLSPSLGPILWIHPTTFSMTAAKMYKALCGRAFCTSHIKPLSSCLITSEEPRETVAWFQGLARLSLSSLKQNASNWGQLIQSLASCRERILDNDTKQWYNERKSYTLSRALYFNDIFS